jgi:hypothetical protein
MRMAACQTRNLSPNVIDSSAAFPARKAPADASPGGRLPPEGLAADLRSLRLTQPKESMAVPVRAGHRIGDLRQAAEVLAVPGKALSAPRVAYHHADILEDFLNGIAQV